MATLKIKIFTKPDRLKEIDSIHLINLLAPWREYLVSRGIDIPENSEDEFPHEKLASALMAYDANMPTDLMNGLYYIDETASNETLDELLERAKEENIEIAEHGQSTAADVAVQLWIQKPELLEERHTKALALRKRSFSYFPGRQHAGRELPDISDSIRADMGMQMDPFFEEKQKGRGTKVFVFPYHNEKKVFILVRHGMPMTREGKHEENGETGVEFYRPQKHDILIYDATIDVLGIHAGSKSEMALYREVLGEKLFGGKGYFGENNIFTLKPILSDGPKIQDCEDIEGITEVRLMEVTRVISGEVNRIDIQKSSDLFRALGDKWDKILKFGYITSAKFGFVFEGSSKTRSVTIRFDSACYDRDSDAEFVEIWLRDKSFYDLPQDYEVVSDDDNKIMANA